MGILGRKYPEYLQFNTLMYSSFSIQESSFEEPRAIVFGPDAQFIFTFNGNSKQLGGMSFESAEYSQESHSFKFREIAFKKYPGFNLHDLNLDPNEIAYQDENIVISTPNPGKCLLCPWTKREPRLADIFYLGGRLWQQ